MPKMFKAFRFCPQLYESFRELASKNGYTVTFAFEKFVSNRLNTNLSFCQPRKSKMWRLRLELSLLG
jgi:hypothetical protein